MELKIALAGNPNCGKTTLFNDLTGSNQYVGNWPGVTVEKKEGKLLAAIIDVLDTEPPEEKDLALLKCPNVLLTPHICGATYEVTDHQSRILNDRLHKWLAGEDLEHTVYNRDVLKA